MAGNDSNTKVLLHFDGANSSTTITDVNLGGSAHTWTNHTGSISTTQSKFGGSSYDSTGGGWVDTPDSTDYTLGSGAFTVDCWVYRSGGSGARRLFCGQVNASGGGASFFIELSASNVFVASLFASSVQTTVTGTTAITTTGWHHVAFVRTSNTLKLFVDGTQEGGDVTFAAAVDDSSNNLAVGRAGEFTTLTWNGYIDEFRLSVGVARWTSNFTPMSTSYGPADLSCSAASFTLTGKAATLVKSKILAAAAAVFTLTGQAVRFPNYFLSAARATFALTGQAAALAKSLHLIAAAASYTFTGVAASLKRAVKLIASPASFTLTGQTLIEAVKPAGSLVIRSSNFVLQQLRTTAPTLDQ